MSKKEIEIQVQVENSQPLLEFLKEQAVFKYEQRQVDEYFSPKDNDYLKKRPVREWLRLRSEGKVNSINHKYWQDSDDGKTHYCDEHEVQVDDSQSMKKILLALDFRSIVTVDKLRKVWHFKDYEISLDGVKGLGDFIEIEYIGQDETVDPKKVTEGMVDFIKDKKCGEIKRNYRGYPFMLLFSDEVEYEIL